MRNGINQDMVIQYQAYKNIATDLTFCPTRYFQNGLNISDETDRI